MKELIQVEIVRYACDVTSKEHKAIAAQMKERGIKPFNVWHIPNDKGQPEGVAHIETKHLFNNQSNTKEGFRVFDWYDGMTNHTRNWRVGHYIKAGPGYDELKEARRNVNRCGYCGHQETAARGTVFHLDCLGNEYLDAKTLHMTRRVCVAEANPEFPALTEAERAYLLPLYKDAQIHGNTERSRARVAKKRQDVAAKYKAAIENAKTEHDGYMWLMDNGVNIDNVIYYNHTGRFAFGWRKPIEEVLYTELCKVLCEFCFDYDIVRAAKSLD